MTFETLTTLQVKGQASRISDQTNLNVYSSIAWKCKNIHFNRIVWTHWELTGWVCELIWQGCGGTSDQKGWKALIHSILYYWPTGILQTCLNSCVNHNTVFWITYLRVWLTSSFTRNLTLASPAWIQSMHPTYSSEQT